ncbi:hypothetical protein LAZ67_1001042 [Cordylochernes scorpioides]|uniref:Protein wntless n=1 Tax=Cordylochernes scorpioides TaxID=51811 RepID=A0ABY6JV43_9ARAC|nr:hypothetical protein LAZ67_1001042 [Cordylochernes scorpioides]
MIIMHAFITFACVCSVLYLIFLLGTIVAVCKNISFKRASLASMSAPRRLYYQGIIFRFQFMLGVTALCAGFTVITFIMGQVSEGQWKWGEDVGLHLPSALLVGQFALWNLYAILMACLFAPSHKTYPPSETLSSTQDEDIEFSRLTTDQPPSHSSVEPTEISALTSFATKHSLD